MTESLEERVAAELLAEVAGRPALAELLAALVARLAAPGCRGQLYACGGLVRDLARAAVNGRRTPLKDVDLVVAGVEESVLGGILEAVRAEVASVRWVERVGAAFPVWKVKVAGLREPVDVAAPRSRASFNAGRGALGHGAAGRTVADDAAHRDFTLNAMYLRVEAEAGGPLRAWLVDPHDGLGAIVRGEIRAVGEASERFDEDPLRVLRAVRFAASFPGFVIAPETAAAIRARATSVRGEVASDRVAAELGRVLAQAPVRGLELLEELGLLGALVPDLAPLGAEGRQRATRRLALLPSELGARPRPALLFAALLLDLARPDELPPPPVWPWQAAIRRVGRVARELHLPDVRAVERLAVGAQVLRSLAHLRCPDAALEELLGRSAVAAEIVALYRVAEETDGRRPVDVRGRLEELEPSRLDFGAVVESLGLPAGPRLRELRLTLRQAEVDGQPADQEAARALLAQLSR